MDKLTDIIVSFMTASNLKPFHKIVIILFIVLVSIFALLILDSTFYFSKYIKNRNKLENLEKIDSLLKNDNIGYDDKKYLIELKKSIINDYNLIDDIYVTLNEISNKFFNSNKKSDNNIIFSFLSHSWYIIILDIIVIIASIAQLYNKEVSIFGALSVTLFFITISVPMIFGMNAITELINLDFDIYIKNIILSIIFLIFIIILMFIYNKDLDKQKNKKNNP
ncbi:hypothetical protein [Brachyspira hyodysenteriae]|uniref:Uncharacterized protein n=2 Tax=Brachyspira hyodysenteriae TaxID=159 RepID=A0A3B6VC19_BRAHW|nr:hypothetical protein [Brachyspira hyodysenteriae]ACN83613.1 hypothetical protein BHWA1_01133 [Brachyspira hyodysenteriae WA1]AUJ49346.1 hypothetical protein BH718_00898 [Brachyspira hyodysenteriae]KLI14622.1 hypothetical protein SU46_11315 [Brachyspira hyodysenteriae]KLI17884.1 hypothetical protein SU45_03890 [Brachyspira hyodysenteriae]KLI20064.1 hypothetical protein SU43_13400 [Brachyspira hyodysenteriae]